MSVFLPSQPLFLLLLLFVTLWQNGAALAGTAAQPLRKQKIAVLGSGGYTGALVFGFLQRAGSLYGTGIDRQVRCIGATQDTSLQLNRVLSKHFILAMADESFVKLTNFEDPLSISDRLQGYDALVIGAGLETKLRAITANTYEKTPNDKTTELYWQGTTLDEPNMEALSIVKNVLQASQHLKHIVALDPKGSFLPVLQEGSVPFTCLQTSSPIITTKDYTYRKGVQAPLSAETTVADESRSDQPIYVEDLAALSVQCLLSLEWSTSRSLHVTVGTMVPPENPKRPDQEWCVNSYLLEAALRAVR